MKKLWIVFFLRWLIPLLLTFAFVFSPDFVGGEHHSPLSSSWLARIFFAVYLINPFIGIAKVVENEAAYDKENEVYEFYTTDNDTLKIMRHLGAIFTVLSTSFVAFFGVNIFFSNLTPLIYIFPSLYTILVSLITIYGLKLQRLRRNKIN